MKTYLVHMIREFDVSEELYQKHWDYLYALRDAGRVGLVGPYTNVQGGAYIFKANSLEEAQAHAKTDPLVANGIAQFVIFEWDAKTL